MQAPNSDRRRSLATGSALALSRLLPAGLLAGLASNSLQAAPIDEGIDFRVLAKPVPTAAAGKVEVLEFFWYACPHCYAMEPAIKAWQAKLPSDVLFRKVHVAFRGNVQQQLFYTLEALMAPEAVHEKAFAAIHLGRKPLVTPAEIFEWARSVGLDGARFEKAWASPAVASNMRRATALMTAHEVEGVPRFTIHGRFVTAPSMVGGSHQRAMAVVDHLIAKARPLVRA
jgi:protein dithiol oxidoreductase (disulfide-forming)